MIINNHDTLSADDTNNSNTNVSNLANGKTHTKCQWLEERSDTNVHAKCASHLPFALAASRSINTHTHTQNTPLCALQFAIPHRVVGAQNKHASQLLNNLLFAIIANKWAVSTPKLDHINSRNLINAKFTHCYRRRRRQSEIQSLEPS